MIFWANILLNTYLCYSRWEERLSLSLKSFLAYVWVKHSTGIKSNKLRNSLFHIISYRICGKTFLKRKAFILRTKTLESHPELCRSEEFCHILKLIAHSLTFPFDVFCITFGVYCFTNRYFALIFCFEKCEHFCKFCFIRVL